MEKSKNIYDCYRKLWTLCDYAINKLQRWSGDDDFANELREQRAEIDEEVDKAMETKGKVNDE